MYLLACLPVLYSRLVPFSKLFTLPYLMLVVSSSQIRFETRVGGYAFVLVLCAELCGACTSLCSAEEGLGGG